MNRTISPTTKIIIFVEFMIILYMIISLTTSEYNNYKIKQYIEQFEIDNQRLAVENDQLRYQYEYYTSPEYQEKIAKQNFGLINHGEKVLIIPEKSKMTPEEEFLDTVISEKVQFYEELPNAVKWWYYFFG